MTFDHSGKGYAPLPQSISNTDTEDEDERSAQTNNVTINNKQRTETTATDPTSMHSNGVYYPLDETKNLGTRIKNRQNTLKYYRDDIPIMVIEGSTQNDLWKRRDMSPIRRLCLVASILLCIATIIIFLYILPCDNSMVCPPLIEPQSSVSWVQIMQEVEVYGPITIVPDSPYNFIFLLRDQEFKDNNTNHRNHQKAILKGIVSMQGNSGIYLWWIPLERVPTNIDCASIDTDRSGKPDCIVVGEHGLLKSIEPIAGTIHWSSAIHTFPKLPVIVPDINSDGTEDLLSVEIGKDRTPSLVLLSGSTGQLLGRYLKSTNCSSVNIYNLVYNGTVLYICHDSTGKRITRYISFKTLLNGMKFSQQYQIHVAQNTLPRFFKTMEPSEDKSNWQLSRYHRLFVENEGTCPGEFCRAYVNLTFQENSNQSVTICNYANPDSFASKPAFLIMSEKPYVTGFAIKLWQWIDNIPAATDTVSTIVERKLLESVLIFFVNYTDVQVINASQSDVTQLCRGTDCHPNLNLRMQFSSLAVAYVNKDKFPELISYSSSYNTDPATVQTSKIQVIRLDSIMSNITLGNP